MALTITIPGAVETTTGSTAPAVLTVGVGAPGVGVPSGGSTGQYLVKASATSYDTAWLTLPANYITSVTAPLAVTSGNLAVDLSAYLTTATAASTYQTIAGMSSYLTSANAASTYAVIAAGQPTSGTVGQVLTKNSGTNYDSSWATLVPGDRYLTSSTTSNSVSNGAKTFTVQTGLSYSPTQDLTIAYNAGNHMHGTVTSYNSGTGVLVVDIKTHTGSGTYTAWTVNVGGISPVASIAWGDITGTLGSQSDLASALNDKLEVTTAASTYYLQTNPDGFIGDAPSDGSQYARQDGAWSVVTGGGGGSYLPLAGGTMTGPIVFDGTSGQYISKGNFDTSRGGNYGISLVCSIGYEFNWQAGWLTTTEQSSVTPRPLYLDSLAGTTLRAWDSSTNLGTEVSHTGITFPDATVQTTAYTGGGGGGFVPGSGNLDMGGYDVINANFNSSAGQVTALNVTISSGGVLTFGDATTQNTSATSAFVQITNSNIHSSWSYVTMTAPAYCIPMFSPTHTDILNGAYVTVFNYDNDYVFNISFNFVGFTSLVSSNINSITYMTNGPSFTGLTSLSNASVFYNDSMITAPSFNGCTSLTNAQVYGNLSMTTAPDFTWCTALDTVNLISCAIGDASLLTALQQVYDYANANAGYFDCSGAGNSSLDPAAIEITQLQAAGWTVVFNSI